MKLLASVVSLFAVASLADKYPPGTNCHTNRVQQSVLGWNVDYHASAG